MNKREQEIRERVERATRFIDSPDGDLSYLLDTIDRLREVVDAAIEFNSSPVEQMMIAGRAAGKTEYVRVRVKLHNAVAAFRATLEVLE